MMWLSTITRAGVVPSVTPWRVRSPWSLSVVGGLQSIDIAGPLVWRLVGVRYLTTSDGPSTPVVAAREPKVPNDPDLCTCRCGERGD